MNWRRRLLLTLSILATGSLSCHGPETGALNLKIGAASDKSSPTQGSLDTETPKSEIEAKLLKPSHSRQSCVDRMHYEKELITLAGFVASFL
jgi:hypothetical protein